ncbi:unnamed protein product [Phaedon cochleariae]|uniref:Uncharacterized protein n=1 Tax=Phaedon cochleariae TaxID=80249 RepID=A0A9N9SDD9_PHACE|nr:unnamed protein product [Phaedon cochleariae]
MYSNSPEDSFKLCNCDNNNVPLDTKMNKLFGDKKIGKKDAKLNNNDVKKEVKSVEVRKEEVLAIRNRFPTKIPVIVQRFFKETHLPQLDKSKFLVPQEITMCQFQTIIRNRIRLNQNQALYLLVNNKSMMSLSLTLAEVYTEHSENDGFLYVTYASQEVFGDGSRSTLRHTVRENCMFDIELV